MTMIGFEFKPLKNKKKEIKRLKKARTFLNVAKFIPGETRTLAKGKLKKVNKKLKKLGSK